MTIMQTRRDLEQWVNDRVGPGDVTEADIERIADAIEDLDGCPWWGDNWAEWLDEATPDNLYDLLHG